MIGSGTTGVDEVDRGTVRATPRPRPNISLNEQARASSLALSLSGLILMGIGVYFAVARPALLPEDVRYLGLTAEQVRTFVPLLSPWLDKVFWVLGGHAFGAGLLVISIARTASRTLDGRAVGTMALAGVTTLGVMTAVDFAIGSDYRWPLLGVAALWAAGLALLATGK